MKIKPHNPTQITLIPMNVHSDYFTANERPLNHSNTNPVPLDCHCDANKPHNATHISLLPMNDYSTNPTQIQCHLTVTVLPNGQQNHTQITLLLRNNQTTIQIPTQCHYCHCDSNQTTHSHSDYFTTNKLPLT